MQIPLASRAVQLAIVAATAVAIALWAVLSGQPHGGNLAFGAIAGLALAVLAHLVAHLLQMRRRKR